LNRTKRRKTKKKKEEEKGRKRRWDGDGDWKGRIRAVGKRGEGYLGG
jgi:hypothetical protein